jgi:hypothetical protein
MYMNTLNLQIKNNNKNYTANKSNNMFVPNKMPDNRTTQEKLSNVNDLKVHLYTILHPLLDGQQQQIAIEQLTNEEIIFVVQRSSYLMEELMPKYSIGMLGNQFVSYIRSLKINEQITINNNIHNGELIVHQKAPITNNELRIQRLKYYERQFDNLNQFELDRIAEKENQKKVNIELAKNILSNWFKKYNLRLPYIIKTGNQSGWNPYNVDDCLSEFINHEIPGINSALNNYTSEQVNNYIIELQTIINIKNQPRNMQFNLFRNSITNWYSHTKINFGRSDWNNILPIHFQFVSEDRFLSETNLIELGEFIQCIIDILRLLKF